MNKPMIPFTSPLRPHLCALAAIVPALLLCACGTRPAAAGRFAGVPIGTLYMDANPEKHAVTLYGDTGFSMGAGSVLNLKVRKFYSFPGGESGMPVFVRVTWRSGEAHLQSDGTFVGGTVVGDYTVPVAERIPDAVLDFVRREGGSLRLKVRVVDDGVLVGWDVEQRVGTGEVRSLVYRMAGGDFCEDRIDNGVVVVPGWERPPVGTNNLLKARQ